MRYGKDHVGSARGTGRACALFAGLLLLLALVPTYVTAEAKVALPLPFDESNGYEADQANYLSDTHYLDETLEVTITTDRHLDSDVWIADVKIADASQLRSAFAGSFSSGRTALAHTIARRVNAVFAVNGDFYNYVMWNGVVIRNGVDYQRRPDGHMDILVIDTDGNLSCVLSPSMSEFDAVFEEMGGAAADGGRVLHALMFGPALVIDGELAYERFSKYNSGERKPTQRTVFAQAEPLHYKIICCSGPESDGSRGMTLDELAAYVHGLGVQVAYNLDGGSSSSMVFNGRKINSLDTHKVRPISDILYFSTGMVME